MVRSFIVFCFKLYMPLSHSNTSRPGELLAVLHDYNYNCNGSKLLLHVELYTILCFGLHY